jgi:hypothetical protein
MLIPLQILPVEKASAAETSHNRQQALQIISRENDFTKANSQRKIGDTENLVIELA